MYPEENEICCEAKEAPTVKKLLVENNKIIDEIMIIAMRNLEFLNGNGANPEPSKEPINMLNDLAIQNDNLKRIRNIVSATAEMLGT